MASNVGIANLALQILGVSTKLESLTQDNPNARAINSCFDSVREGLLRRFPWNFAKKRASLPALTEQTVWGNLNQYTLPVDYLRLLRPTDRQTDWEIEAGDGADVIVTRDTAPLDIRYIADITDPAQFDSEFVMVFAAMLAKQTAQEITESAAKQKIADDRYDMELAIAKNANAFERAPDAAIPYDYLIAMQSGGGWWTGSGWGSF